MKRIGIIGGGVKLPKKRLGVDECIRVWKNNNADYIKKVLMVNCRTVLDSDEDLITLSVAAAKSCLENCRISADDMESVYLGTTTSPDLFVANSTVVMDMLSSKGNYLNGDIQASEKSGTAALINAFAVVNSGLAKNALVIGADVLSRHIAPGELREPYIGSGAGAVLIGSDNVIAEIQCVASYNTNFPEQCRTEDERFLRLLAPLGRNLVKEGMLKHCCNSVKSLLAKSGMKICDFSYGVFQQFTGNSALLVGDAIGMEKEKILPSIFAGQTGDTGSASPFIGLSRILEIAKPGDNILLCSYGHGTGSDAISLSVTNEVTQYQQELKNLLSSELNENLIKVTYEEAMKYEYKYIQPNVALSAYI